MYYKKDLNDTDLECSGLEGYKECESCIFHERCEKPESEG